VKAPRWDGRVQARRKSDRREGPSIPIAHKTWTEVSNTATMNMSGALHHLLRPAHAQ
jgi:hypothetical protein